jgi:hypothetical protein
MEKQDRFLHDRLVLLLTTIIAILLVIGVGVVLLRFDVSKNPTTVVAYRPNITGTQYLSGKPIDIYSLAVFMVLTALASVALGARTYSVRRSVSVFILASSVFLLLLAIRVAWSIISLQ